MGAGFVCVHPEKISSTRIGPMHSFSHLLRPSPLVMSAVRIAGLFLAIFLTSACARIEPEQCEALVLFDQLSTPSDSVAAQSPVFVSAEYLVKKKLDSKLTSSLESSIEEQLRSQGFETTEDESKSASKISCTVSTWPGYGTNTDSIALLTLGMYTPFHYPWTIQTKVTDQSGMKSRSLNEKGKFFIYSIGTILLHIPTAIVFSTAVPAKRRELGENAAKMVVVLLSNESISPLVESADATTN